MVLFAPGAIAMSTKRGSLATGSFMVVKSTRQSNTTRAELGCLTLFSPTQGPEAKEYASIIEKTEASGQPASFGDSARLAILEGISGHSLVDADRAEVMKLCSCCPYGWGISRRSVPRPPVPPARSPDRHEASGRSSLEWFSDCRIC